MPFPATMVNIRTVNLKTGAIHYERQGNWDNPGFRRFYDKHVTWAVNNGHGVQMWNATDMEPNNG